MDDPKRDELQLVAENWRAVISVNEGARLTSLAHFGAALLVDEPPASAPFRHLMYGSFLMCPWVGRLRDASFSWKGLDHRVRPNWGRHAIHGLVAQAPWYVVSSTDQRATLECRLGEVGWPFGGTARQTFEVAPSGMTMRAEIIAEEEPFPAALGWHPWFRIGGETTIQLDASDVLALDDELIPTGAIRPVDRHTDLREGQRVRGLELDHVYVNPSPPARINHPDAGGLEISWSAAVEWVVVYVSDSAVCIEPQTAWPDAFHPSPDDEGRRGMSVVRPGRPLSVEQRWTWSGPARPVQ